MSRPSVLPQEHATPGRAFSDRSALIDFLEWDVRNWSGALEFWRANTRKDFSRCSALELGSRNGGLALWLASQGARVVCSDVELPGERAVSMHRTHGVSHLVDYRAISALDIPFSNEFDLVVFKSILGIVGNTKERQAQAIAQMHKALKEGGELLFAENLSASFLHRFFRTRFVEWAQRWRYVTVREMQEFLSPFSSVKFRTMGFAGAFGRSESQRNLLGRLDQALLDHVLPQDCNYIIAGVAVK